MVEHSFIICQSLSFTAKLLYTVMSLFANKNSNLKSCFLVSINTIKIHARWIYFFLHNITPWQLWRKWVNSCLDVPGMERMSGRCGVCYQLSAHVFKCVCVYLYVFFFFFANSASVLHSKLSKFLRYTLYTVVLRATSFPQECLLPSLWSYWVSYLTPPALQYT